ncbi:MAG: hypothetical protein LWY06_07150 [Firmicutes bacterium]|nr:hypothetical protein [Bacillota bacterium]
MTEIRDAGSLNYTNTNMVKNPPAKLEQEPQVAPPADQVTISKPEKTLAQKIISFPGKVIEGVAGTAVAVVSTPLHILPGAVKGLSEGISDYKGNNQTRPFYSTLFLQNIAIGAGTGFAVGGPLGAAIGGGAGLIASGLLSWFGDKTEAYSQMISSVEKKVDKAVEDNKGTKTEVAFQSATEGGIIGGAVGAKAGWKIGFETGKGVVSGVVGVAEGVAEGVYEVGKNILKGK